MLEHQWEHRPDRKQATVVVSGEVVTAQAAVVRTLSTSSSPH